MEPTKFDNLTKALATSTSRRQALKTIAATTLGGILGLSGLGTAFGATTCHRNGLGCDTNSQCCSNYCANGEKCTCPPAPACNSYCPCPSGETCVSGACTCGSAGDCPNGQNCCNGVCVNEQTDVNNCGSCGHVCASGQVCQNGTCVTPCTANGGTCSASSNCCSGFCFNGK